MFLTLKLFVDLAISWWLIMLKKLHIKLTIICTIFTGIILLITSLFCLYSAKKSIINNEYSNFKICYNTIYSYLQSENTISYSWLSQTEENYNVILYIEDNSSPISYNSVIESEKRNELIKYFKDFAIDNYDFDISSNKINTKALFNIDFSGNYEKEKYYVSVGSINKGSNNIGVLIIYSLENCYNKIFTQNITFIFIDIIALLSLGFFAYFFTKHTIKPIEKSQERQVQFIASASHELRSPLAVITSASSALKKASPKDQEKFIDMISSESNRMAGLINDMLLLASANNESWSINKTEEELDTILLNTYEEFELLAKEKNISLSIELPDYEIPKCKCDKERIIQVLFILINNALSYTQSGGKVKLSLKAFSNHIEIYVIDNGIGISDKDKEHIFEPFYRRDSSHNSKEHFGLGLSIAYEIIRLHKGNIIIKDTLEKGSTFIISLPN